MGTGQGREQDGNTIKDNSAGVRLLVIWALLCAIWNAYGAFQISHGGSALGPTASYGGALLALVLAGAVVFTAGRWPTTFRIVAVLAGALAAYTIWNSFVQDRSLWPSEFWRWAGIVVNAIGVCGAMLSARPNDRHSSDQ